MPTWGRGGRAVGGDGRVWAARGARSPAPPVHGAGGASVGSCEVRRWVRHSVRCWSHATEGSQTRHVAGSWSQQRLLRASASRTDASRSSCWWPRPQWRWVRRDVGHMVWDTRTRSTPFGEHPGDHVRAEGADGDGRGAAPWPRSARSSALDSATRTRPEMPQVSGGGVKNERTRGRAGRCAPGFNVGSSGTRATPADHTDTLHPSGVHIALLTGPLGVVGVSPGAP